MAYTYNYDRSHDERSRRYDELERKSCLRADARYVVIRGSRAYDGLASITDFNSDNQSCFDDLRTARAFAHYASDMHFCSFGIYR